MFIECKRPTFRDVYNYVVPKCAHKWRFLGALLHFDQAELDTIFSNFRYDSEDCCRNLLSRWLEKNPNTTWDQLLSAIDDLSQPPLAEITYQGMNQIMQCYIRSYMRIFNTWRHFNNKRVITDLEEHTYKVIQYMKPVPYQF